MLSLRRLSEEGLRLHQIVEDATLLFKGRFKLLCPQRQFPSKQSPESQPGIMGQSSLVWHDGAGACTIVEVGGAEGAAVVEAGGAEGAAVVDEAREKVGTHSV